MKTIKQLEQEKAKIEKQIETLKAKEQEKDFIEVKDFRIYKWSNPVKDFPMPKGFELAKERDFIDLYDNDLIELEKYPVIYFTKNRSEKNAMNGFGLSRLYLSGDLYLGSGNGDLADSDDDGRVVVRKISKKVSK